MSREKQWLNWVWRIEILSILDMLYLIFSTYQSSRQNKKLFEWLFYYLNSFLKFKFRAFRPIDQSEHSILIWLEKWAPKNTCRYCTGLLGTLGTRLLSTLIAITEVYQVWKNRQAGVFIKWMKGFSKGTDQNFGAAQWGNESQTGFVLVLFSERIKLTCSQADVFTSYL